MGSMLDNKGVSESIRLDHAGDRSVRCCDFLDRGGNISVIDHVRIARISERIDSLGPARVGSAHQRKRLSSGNLLLRLKNSEIRIPCRRIEHFALDRVRLIEACGRVGFVIEKNIDFIRQADPAGIILLSDHMPVRHNDIALLSGLSDDNAGPRGSILSKDGEHADDALAGLINVLSAGSVYSVRAAGNPCREHCDDEQAFKQVF